MTPERDPHRAVGGEECPNCGTLAANVQGVATCPRCGWIAT